MRIRKLTLAKKGRLLIPESISVERGIPERSGGNFVGAYLQGLFAIGDADAGSDCDFISKKIIQLVYHSLIDLTSGNVMLYQRSLDIEQRLEAILRLIRSGGYSTPRLAQRLGVSVPTVSRYVTALKDRGHNIRSERRDEGWQYVLNESPNRTRSTKRSRIKSLTALQNNISNKPRVT